MVLNVTRLRRRGLTRRCAPLPLLAPFPLLDPLPFDPFPFEPLPLSVSGERLGLPIFEKQARMAAGGKPVNADCGYSPRSATLIEDGSRSLPTMWIDQSFAWLDKAGGGLSEMPPLRLAALESLLPLPFPLPLLLL